VQCLGSRACDIDLSVAESDGERLDVEYRGTSDLPSLKKSVVSQRFVILSAQEEKELLAGVDEEDANVVQQSEFYSISYSISTTHYKRSYSRQGSQQSSRTSNTILTSGRRRPCPTRDIRRPFPSLIPTTRKQRRPGSNSTYLHTRYVIYPSIFTRFPRVSILRIFH